MNDPSLRYSLENGFLQFRLTTKCNARCKFCPEKELTEYERKSVSKEMLYEYCKPLYDQIKCLLLIGGEPLMHEECMPFCRFISENYPQITLMFETNGMAFTEEWQQFAVKHLMRMNFSVNGSNEAVYCRGCQQGEAGGATYRKVVQNIRRYMELLKESELEVFAPCVSMVINRDTADDVPSFLKYALTEGACRCTFHFDYMENASREYFVYPEIVRPALFELVKLERVLAGKFFIQFRLFVPSRELEMIQPKVEAIPINELRDEYSDILELAVGRSMKSEYEKRQEIRKNRGKRTFSFDEDWVLALQQTVIHNKLVCFKPFHYLIIDPDNSFRCCSWLFHSNMDSVISDGFVDWEKEYNNAEMMKIRKDMLEGRYDHCMKNCPLNPIYKEVCTAHKYGYERNE